MLMVMLISCQIHCTSVSGRLQATEADKDSFCCWQSNPWQMSIASTCFYVDVCVGGYLMYLYAVVFWKQRYLQIYIYMFDSECIGKPSIVHTTATPNIGHWNHRLMNMALDDMQAERLYLGWRMAHLSCFTIGWCEVQTLIWYPVNMADGGGFKRRVSWGYATPTVWTSCNSWFVGNSGWRSLS